MSTLPENFEAQFLSTVDKNYTLSERIRHARSSAGLTQQEVIDKLAELGYSLTKAGLSKYELGKSAPSTRFLKYLGHALGVSSSYFIRNPNVTIRWIAFRKKSRLSQARQDQIKATVLDKVESLFWLQTTLNALPAAVERVCVPARTTEDAEHAANTLRQSWGLSDLPIRSITQVIEERSGFVIGYQDDLDEFDGLSGWINGTFPLIVVNTATSDDRRRYNLAHELGHMIMECDLLGEREQEELAHRFAAAFIVPSDVARRELGQRRPQLTFPELCSLKSKYGLSMQAWVRRACDLGIIDPGHYRTLCLAFSRRGWRKQEPVVYEADETPTKLKHLTLRAVAEAIITPERAAQICPECLVDIALATESAQQSFSFLIGDEGSLFEDYELQLRTH